MEFIQLFLAVLAALELSKYLNGKRQLIRKKIIQAKRKIKKWFRKKFNKSSHDNNAAK